MFRLFLRKKILAGVDKATSKKRPPAKTLDEVHNRRVFARYNVDHKHLTLMNDADILLVREISASGFSTEVSERGFERLVVGDVYEARMRYLGEIYDLQARVAWKADNFIGFEIIKSAEATLNFMKRLLRPIEIASSLSLVDSAFMTEGKDGKSWYHGDDETDLYVWHHPETEELSAWQLTVAGQYIEWNASTGLVTGKTDNVAEGGAFIGANLKGVQLKQDSTIDIKKRQLAVDVIMALQFPVREDLLETLSA